MSIANLKTSIPAIETSQSIETTQSKPLNILSEDISDSEAFGDVSYYPSDETQMLNELFTLRDGVIRNEKWHTSYILSGRVNAISDEFVVCETIIDKASKKTETRTYPRIQFAHLPVLKIGSTVKLKINEKPGSFRLDIIDGTNMGVEKEFATLVSWDDLADFKMDNPEDIDDENYFQKRRPR